MNAVDNLNSVLIINKPCMRSRCMSLLPRTTLHSDSEHLWCWSFSKWSIFTTQSIWHLYQSKMLLPKNTERLQRKRQKVFVRDRSDGFFEDNNFFRFSEDSYYSFLIFRCCQKLMKMRLEDTLLNRFEQDFLVKEGKKCPKIEILKSFCVNERKNASHVLWNYSVT